MPHSILMKTLVTYYQIKKASVLCRGKPISFFIGNIIMIAKRIKGSPLKKRDELRLKKYGKEKIR